MTKKTKDKKHVASLSINKRPKDASPEYMFELAVRDEGTGRKLLTVEISAEELMLSLANLHARPCTITFEETGMALLGKRKEVMQLKILKRGAEPRIPKKYAEQGWAHGSGYGNHHAARKDEKKRDCYLCTLFRYVDDDGDFEPETLP